jgi:hypothetical protein
MLLLSPLGGVAGDQENLLDGHDSVLGLGLHLAREQQLPVLAHRGAHDEQHFVIDFGLLIGKLSSGTLIGALLYRIAICLSLVGPATLARLLGNR